MPSAAGARSSGSTSSGLLDQCLIAGDRRFALHWSLGFRLLLPSGLERTGKLVARRAQVPRDAATDGQQKGAHRGERAPELRRTTERRARPKVVPAAAGVGHAERVERKYGH